MKRRNLVLVLGDQLDLLSPAFEEFDAAQDLVWMAELPEESEHVKSHKARTVLFLSAMRHFSEGLAERAIPLRNLRIGDHPHSGFAAALSGDIAAFRPQRLLVAHPRDFRVLNQLQQAASEAGLPLEVRTDRKFLIGMNDFRDWANGRKALRLEHFYRHMRRRNDVLLEGKNPMGGSWNFDKENRKIFGRQGPGAIPAPAAFPADAITHSAIADVEQQFPNHPGSLAHVDWPVTPEQAEAALQDLVEHRLPAFGPFQDALWSGEIYLYHSRLSAA
ncbi:MAG: cryptochrome/photolyase family protein, partial [Chromatiaceae bacterium]|nr:cryptochrome/photolyase family protein [Chromatiaceae bacterium]